MAKEKKEVSDAELLLKATALIEGENPHDRVSFATGYSSIDLNTGANIRDLSALDGMSGVTVEQIIQQPLVSMPRGLRDGAFVMLTGKPSTGKSTLALNVAGNVKRNTDIICKEQGVDCRVDIHILPTEDGIDLLNVYKYTKLTDEHIMKGELKIKDGVITTEVFRDYIEALCDAKIKAKGNKIEMKAMTGKMKKVYVPTIVILDSWSMLTPAKLLEADREISNMFDAQKIKENGNTLLVLFQKMREANVMLFTINHLKQKIQTDMFKPNTSDYQSMGSDEGISGGKVCQYLMDLVIYFTKTDASYNNKSRNIKDILCIDDNAIGFAVEIKYVKNRYGDSGARARTYLVFDGNIGYNPWYSMLYETMENYVPIFMKLAGTLKKTFVNHQDILFYNKEVPTLLRTDKNFMKVFREEYNHHFRDGLESYSISKFKNKDMYDLMDAFLSA